MADGGPAFPTRIPLEHNAAQGKDYPGWDEAGMSLRDVFAVSVSAGMVQTLSLTAPADEVADAVWRMADALIRRRYVVQTEET